MTRFPWSPCKHRLTLGATGVLAAGILDDGGPIETVAVFARSFYAADRRSRLVCFVRDDLEPGPLNLLCSGWPDNPGELLPVKTAWTVYDGFLSSPRLEIFLGGRRPWSPSPYPAPKPDQVRSGLAALLNVAKGRCPVDSVAALLLAPSFSRNGVRGAILSATEKGVSELAAWLAGNEPGADPCSLLGLGGGLTPSGDDVLGGALLGLHALGLAGKAESLVELIGNAARTRTNRISQAHLGAASGGLGAAPLHDCLAAVLTGGKGLDKVIPRLNGVGHTSGWDAILGITVAIQHYLEVGYCFGSTTMSRPTA